MTLRTFTSHEVWLLLLAARWTIALAFSAFVCGGLVALFVATARVSPFRSLRYAASGYIQLVQAIPVLMLLLLFYFGLNLFGIRVDAWTAAILAFTLSTSSFLAEIWRGCLQAVPLGQWDAARSLGLQFPAHDAARDHAASGANGPAADRRLHGAGRQRHVPGGAHRLYRTRQSRHADQHDHLRTNSSLRARSRRSISPSAGRCRCSAGISNASSRSVTSVSRRCDDATRARSAGRPEINGRRHGDRP